MNINCAPALPAGKEVQHKHVKGATHTGKHAKNRKSNRTELWLSDHFHSINLDSEYLYSFVSSRIMVDVSSPFQSLHSYLRIRLQIKLPCRVLTISQSQQLNHTIPII